LIHDGTPTKHTQEFRRSIERDARPMQLASGSHLFDNGVTRNALPRDFDSHRAIRGKEETRAQITHISGRSCDEGGGQQLPERVP
jgi:hypothetical protein